MPRYDVRSIAASGAILAAATMIGWVIYVAVRELLR